MTDIDDKPAAEPAGARNAAPQNSAADAASANSAASALAQTRPGLDPGVEELVERWWQDHFPGSAVARDTQAWNHAHRAKDELKRRLAAFRE